MGDAGDEEILIFHQFIFVFLQTYSIKSVARQVGRRLGKG